MEGDPLWTFICLQKPFRRNLGQGLATKEREKSKEKRTPLQPHKFIRLTGPLGCAKTIQEEFRQMPCTPKVLVAKVFPVPVPAPGQQEQA